MRKPLLIKIAGGLGLAGLVLLAYRLDPSGRYVSVPGLLLILFGSFTATALAHSFRGVFDLMRRLPDELRTGPAADPHELQTLVRIADWHRLGQIRLAEQSLRKLNEPLLRQGAEQVLNRMPPPELHRMLHWRIAAQREAGQERVKIVRTAAAFAPTFGMVGTLSGLIEMMYAMDASRLQHMGSAMGFALLTTLYGLLFANLLLKPIAARLETRLRERIAWLHVQAETVRLLGERSHPGLIQDYWRTFQERVEPAENDSVFWWNKLKKAA